ncbi:DUF5068 domain-containing protein [Virgibacillus sp. NKC19-3]|uniref:DUF5068 domain-containing protein n=1 Tax=Virgibacillus saliphilus TaxID=2831674 RepID=UPI001C9B02AE|nr:DUF5068 domain-containing protein [Virgibacillus sp. NKC19-3]MBY7142354.1 DUF5068 domain-containing protein [Virgibacillus sp. NKC19-3]
MAKKLTLLLATLFLTAVVISGCGSEDAEEAEADAEPAAEENEDETEEDEESEEPEETEEEMEVGDEEEEAEDSEGDSDFEALITYMEDETEGTTKVMYENDESQEHDMEGVNVSLDGYTLVELTDFHTNYEIPFDDQTDGGVIIAKYTVKNDTDDDVSYMPTFDMTYDGAEKMINNYRELLPEDEQLPVMLSPDDDYMIDAGDEVTGYYTYPFGQDRLDDVMDKGTVDVEVPQPQQDPDDFSSTFGEDGRFEFTLDQDSSDEKEEKDGQNFYEDKVTADNMGDKTMLKEKDGIDESEELGDITVTLDGYQFTEFEPNEEEAPRFEDFSEGVVLLTVKFAIDNENASEVGHSSIMSTLTVNDGSQYMINEGMLLNYRNDDMIDSGESGELLQVYVLDQEQYEKIWKDKAFEVEVGPMKDQEAQDISKGKEATFTLPE